MRQKILSLLILFLCTYLQQLIAQCTASAALPGSAFTDNAAVGLVTWSNPTKALASDNSRASAGTLVGTLATVNTHYLYATGFNLSVPSNASICGIEVNIEHRQTGVATGYSVRDNIVQLINGGTITGNNKAQITDWLNHDDVVTYGGTTDTWGVGLTAADVNASDFGIAISATLRAGLTSVFLTAEIDYITVTVYYDVAQILPVQYVSFNAEDKGPNGIALNWQTLSETNNNYFAVERSSDGAQYKQVRVVKGAGTTLEPMSYYTLDEHPVAGQLYYRIRQVDYNGKCTYSTVREVRYTGKPSISSACTSNGNIVVHIYVPEDMPVDVQLMNVTGGVVRSFRQNLESGHSEVKMVADNLTSGIYFVKAKVGSAELYQKIYVVND